MSSAVARRLLTWYAGHARVLPWRRTRDPYAVWVSETMLQQTQVATVIPYYERWMRRFPSMGSLAAAPLEEVLRLWEGLGYYRRAILVHRAAQRVVAEMQGVLPAGEADLRRLPGVGRYTAAAIAAIAFDADVLALDGNLRRVLSRLLDLTEDPRTPRGEAGLLARAARLLPRGKASAFNQALMDLGAMVCLPRKPACELCPLRRECLAFARGVQEARPVRAPRPAIPRRTEVAGVIRRSGRVLVARRPEGGLLGGLWEFPGGRRKGNESLRGCLSRVVREGLGVAVDVGGEVLTVSHAYTHFRVTVHAFECRLEAAMPRLRRGGELRWVRPAQLRVYPMGKVDRAIAAAIAPAASRPRRHPAP